jgi:hypothetical protein
MTNTGLSSAMALAVGADQAEQSGPTRPRPSTAFHTMTTNAAVPAGAASMLVAGGDTARVLTGILHQGKRPGLRRGAVSSG